MPSSKKHPKDHQKSHSHSADHETTKAKRRPGRDHTEHETPAEPQVHHEHAKAETHHETHAKSETHEKAHEEVHVHPSHGKKKIEVSFPGSEILRAKIPEPFKVVDAIATDWVNDGKFEGLAVGHPLAQVVAASGLRKAKDLEKKVLESGLLEKVATQAFTLGLKAQSEISAIRDQVKSRFGKK